MKAHGSRFRTIGVAAVVSSCLAVAPVPGLTQTRLEGLSRGAINRIDDRGVFTTEFGPADAATTDGRFALYSLTREGNLRLGQIATMEWNDGTTHLLAGFDAGNETQSTSYHHCDDDSDDALCRLSPDEILWQLIGELSGQQESARLRELDRVHAELAPSLHVAVVAGNIGEIEALLERGASINTDIGGLSPLHRAAQTGQIEVVALLDALGVPIDARSSRASETPLHLAAGAGHPATVDWLLSNGAMIDAVDASGSTPLRTAAASGQSESAMRLIDAGADVQARPGDILGLATRYGDVDLVAALLEHGANVDDRVRPRFSLRDTPPPEPGAPLSGPPALFYAVTEGKLEAAEVLLRHGARLDAGENRYDPLHAAILSDDLAMVELLLEHGANANRRVRIDDGGRLSPLERAAQLGSEEVVQLLRRYGARR